MSTPELAARVELEGNGTPADAVDKNGPLAARQGSTGQVLTQRTEEGHQPGTLDTRTAPWGSLPLTKPVRWSVPGLSNALLAATAPKSSSQQAGSSAQQKRPRETCDNEGNKLPGADTGNSLSSTWTSSAHPTVQQRTNTIPNSQGFPPTSSEAKPEASPGNPTPCTKQRRTFQAVMEQESSTWFSQPGNSKQHQDNPKKESKSGLRSLVSPSASEADPAAKEAAQRLGKLGESSNTLVTKQLNDKPGEQGRYNVMGSQPGSETGRLPQKTLPVQVQQETTSKALVPCANTALTPSSSTSLPDTDRIEALTADLEAASLLESYCQEDLATALGVNKELHASLRAVHESLEHAQGIIGIQTLEKARADGAYKELFREAAVLKLTLSAAKEREVFLNGELSASQKREHALLKVRKVPQRGPPSPLSNLMTAIEREEAVSARLRSAVIEKQDRLIELGSARVEQVNTQERYMEAALAHQGASREVAVLKNTVDAQKSVIMNLEKELMKATTTPDKRRAAPHRPLLKIDGMRELLSKLTDERVRHEATKALLNQAQAKMLQMSTAERLSIQAPAASKKHPEESTLQDPSKDDQTATGHQQTGSKDSAQPSGEELSELAATIAGYAEEVKQLEAELQKSCAQREHLGQQLLRMESEVTKKYNDVRWLEAENSELKERVAALESSQGDGSISPQSTRAAPDRNNLDGLSELAIAYGTDTQQQQPSTSMGSGSTEAAEQAAKHMDNETLLAAGVLKLMEMAGGRTRSLGYVRTGDKAKDEAGLLQEELEIRDGLTLISKRIVEAKKLSDEKERLTIELETMKGKISPADIQRLTKQRDSMVEAISSLRAQLRESKWKRTKLVRLLDGHPGHPISPLSPMPPSPQLDPPLPDSPAQLP